MSIPNEPGSNQGPVDIIDRAFGANEAPVLTGDLFATVAETGSYAIASADLGFDDPDDAPGDVIFTVSNLANGILLVSGVSATRFSGKDLTAGLVSFVHDGSETASASFSVSVEDGDEDVSVPAVHSFDVTVSPVNDAPSVTAPGSYAATEQVDLSLKNGGLLVADPDAGTGIVTLTLTVAEGRITANPGTSGAAVARIANGIAITGTIAEINALLNTDPTSTIAYRNYSDTPPASVDLVLSIDDGGGSQIDQRTVPIRITPVNDSPQFFGAGFLAFAAEFAVAGTVVGTVGVIDPDGPSATFSLTDNAGGRFAIDAATGRISVLNGLLLDYEQAATHQITVEVSDGVGTPVSANLFVQIDNVEPELVRGTRGADNFVGGAGDDRLAGYRGDDTLTGGGGNDTLAGGIGTNTLIGGTGDDLYYVDSSTDTVIELAGLGFDRVIASTSFTLPAHVEALTLSRSGLTGTGNGADNTFYSCSTGNTLVGLAGNDTYVVGANVTIVETAGGGIDRVYSAARHILAAYVENMTLTGAAAVNGAGNGLANGLIGNAGANWLYGLGGNDRLAGGFGADIMIGGPGNDVFDFNAIADSGVGAGKRDMIGDFARGYDKIDLASMDANSLVAGNQAFVFHGAASFAGAGQLRYVQEGGGLTAKTILWGNVDGNLSVDFHIELKGHVALMASDFVL